jgi:carboxymethylenebutenolidase
MTRHDVQIETPDGTADGSLHFPTGSGPWPAVLMLPDAGGLRPTFHGMGERLAELGYVTLVPDVYYRDAPWAPFPMHAIYEDDRDRARITAFMQSVTAQKAVRDARAFVRFLQGRPETIGDSVAVVGYCMGGRLALIVASHLGDSIAAVASFHGGNLAATDDPDSPHHRAQSITAEIYVAGATNDHSFPDEQRDRLERALTEAKCPHLIDSYAGAHGFSVPDNPNFDAPSAERHWAALAELLQRSFSSNRSKRYT